jgi:hypothetical protein
MTQQRHSRNVVSTQRSRSRVAAPEVLDDRSAEATLADLSTTDLHELARVAHKWSQDVPTRMAVAIVADATSSTGWRGCGRRSWTVTDGRSSLFGRNGRQRNGSRRICPRVYEIAVERAQEGRAEMSSLPCHCQRGTAVSLHWSVKIEKGSRCVTARR